MASAIVLPVCSSGAALLAGGTGHPSLADTTMRQETRTTTLFRTVMKDRRHGVATGRRHWRDLHRCRSDR